MITSVLLIAESQAHWESWAKIWCIPGYQLVLILQVPSESADEFQKRIASCIDRLTAARCRLSQVLLAPTANGNAATYRARTQIIDMARLKLAGRPTHEVRVLRHDDWRTAPCSTSRA